MFAHASKWRWGAPGVLMPLFYHDNKWKVCVSAEKGIAQRYSQSFQARSQQDMCHFWEEKKKKEKHMGEEQKNVKTAD